MTTKQIRDELKEIKYYYSRKDFIDKSSQTIGKNNIYALVEKYNKAICDAPCRMYDLYVSIYKENNTLESLSDNICYSVEYVAKLHQKLVKYFQKVFKEEEAV